MWIYEKNASYQKNHKLLEGLSLACIENTGIQ